MRRRAWTVFAALAAGLAAGPVSGQGAGGMEEAATHESATVAERGAVVFLVRHGEAAMDGRRDPRLSEKGRARAERLASLLADAGLTAVYTTDYRRTRGTAAPAADTAGLEPRLYDPRTLVSFADSLRARGGRVLVVGHSNTTSELVSALGGDPGTPIAEWEHDRVYIVFLPAPGMGPGLASTHGAATHGSVQGGSAQSSGLRSGVRTILLRY